MQEFVNAMKSSMSLHKGNEARFTIDYRPLKNITSGAVGIQKMFVQKTIQQDLVLETQQTGRFFPKRTRALFQNHAAVFHTT
jgi:hypothetical protein